MKWSKCEMAEEPVTTVPSGPDEIQDQNREKKRALPAGVIAGAVFLAVVVAGLFLLIRYQSESEGPPPLSPEADAYLAHLAVADLRLTAEENFLGQQVVYLDGRLANQGDKTIRQLKLRLYFRDVLNQVILREDHDVIGTGGTGGTGTAPLAPGEGREFRLLFDRIPDSWNQQVPQFQLVFMEIE